MFSMHRLFLACVVGASALRHPRPDVKDVDHHHHQHHHHHHSHHHSHHHHERRVLLFGCSLDRNALHDFCLEHGEHTAQTDQPVQTSHCFSKELHASVGYMFHPGVGINGDLHRPTALARYKATGAILKSYANATAFQIFKASPHLVVVDTSLWDLMGWRLGTPRGQGLPALPTPVTEERFQQWCQQDMPNLMKIVSQKFPTSRIAFRTAPTILFTPKYEKFERHDVDMLYQCINSSTENGMLLGKYEIIDYHKIMEHLIDRKVPDLYMADGYHPTWYPSRLYVNEILRRVGLNPQDPVEPSQHKNTRTADRNAMFEMRVRGDPNDMDLIWAEE